MTAKLNKVCAVLIAAGISAPPASAHSSSDFVPMFVAMPLGQVAAMGTLILVAMKLRQSRVVLAVTVGGSILTTLLAWHFRFPFLDSALSNLPGSLTVAVLGFLLYGLVTTFVGGAVAGWVVRLLAHLDT